MGSKQAISRSSGALRVQRRRDVIDYIRTMTGQLGAMAEEADLALLAHFLNMAFLAAEVLTESGEPRPPRIMPAAKRVISSGRRAKH